MPEASILQQIESAQDWLQKSFASLMLAVAKGDAIDMKQVQEQFPLPLTSVREYANRSLATF